MILNKDKDKDNNINQSPIVKKEHLMKRYIKNVKNIFRKKHSE